MRKIIAFFGVIVGGLLVCTLLMFETYVSNILGISSRQTILLGIIFSVITLVSTLALPRE